MTYIHTHIYSMYVFVYVRMYVCMYVCTYPYPCICEAYLYVHICRSCIIWSSSTLKASFRRPAAVGTPPSAIQSSPAEGPGDGGLSE